MGVGVGEWVGWGEKRPSHQGQAILFHDIQYKSIIFLRERVIERAWFRQYCNYLLFLILFILLGQPVVRAQVSDLVSMLIMSSNKDHCSVIFGHSGFLLKLN